MQEYLGVYFINSASSRILLVMEPKSSEFWIKRGASVRVVIKDSGLLPEVQFEYLLGGLVIYLHKDSSVDV
jgi:hypothetical protein